MIEYVPIHPDHTRVAAITFGQNTRVEYDFISENPITKCELFDGDDPPFDKIRYVNDLGVSGGTNIKEAIMDAADIMEIGKKSRPKVNQVVLLFTDGDYEREDDPYEVVKQLQEKNITMFCVGIGSWLVPGNVRSLASRTEYYETHDAWKDMLYERLFSVPSGWSGLIHMLT